MALRAGRGAAALAAALTSLRLASGPIERASVHRGGNEVRRGLAHSQARVSRGGTELGAGVWVGKRTRKCRLLRSQIVSDQDLLLAIGHERREPELPT